MRILRFLLRFLPTGFRDEYGRELLETAGEQWAEARPSLGAAGRLRFWARQWFATIRISVALRVGRRSLGTTVGGRRRRETWTEGVGNDFRQGARALMTRPGFTFVAVVTLGLGVGATTAMFSTVKAVLLRPLPYGGVERIVVLRQTNARDGSLRDGVSAANMRDVAARSRTLTHVSIAGAYGFSLMWNGRAVSLRGWVVSEGFLEAMGGRALIGRAFVSEEFVPGREKVVLLSHRTWQSRFAGDPGIVGRQIVLDEAAHTVIGVLPSDFKYPGPSEVFAPRPPQPWDDDTRAGSQLYGVARLSGDASIDQAQRELDRIAADLADAFPSTNASTGIRVIPLRRHLLGNVEPPLILLLGAVTLVLFIATANVAGLLLARGTGRSREYALRGALGASSWRILRLACVESLLLAGLGSLVGIGLAHVGVDLIRRLGPDRFPRIDEIRMDGIVLSFALLLAAGSGVAAGIGPALRASRAGLRGTLAGGSRGMRGRRETALRDRLVVAEIALALVLVIGAGLLLQSFDRLLDNRLGFEPQRRLAVQVFAYDDHDQPDLNFVRRSIAELRAVPGVEVVGITTALPLADDQSISSMSGTTRVTFEGRPAPAAGDEPMAWLAAIDGAYPEAIGVSLKAGRAFSTLDLPQSAPVMMVNEVFVRRHFPDEDPVGRRVTLQRGSRTPREIVGVLADVRPKGFLSEPRPEVYVPLFQLPITGGVTFVVKSATDPAALTRPVQEALWSVDPGQATWAARPISDLTQDWVRQRRFQTALLVTFACLALSLAGIGVHGLMSFSVAQRVRELGIRRALGGQSRSIVGMILKRALALALAGTGAGLLGSLALTRLLQGMLFGIQPFDPATFAVLSMFVIAVVVLAGFVPAMRAMRVDPLVALRAE